MINTDGADRKPAVAIRVKNVTTSAVHAGWSFFLIARAYLLTLAFREKFLLDIGQWARFLRLHGDRNLNALHLCVESAISSNDFIA
jgi:hypothetical protein